MEQFIFPLQNLLDIRKEKEEKSKQNFVEAQMQKKFVEEKLKGLEENYSKYRDYSKDETIVEKKLKNNYLNSLTRQIIQTNKELNKKDEMVERKREDLKQDQISRKTVEILKEKKQRAFIDGQNRIEQLQNDEFALYSFIRRAK
jgi:flagellar protein FliJ